MKLTLNKGTTTTENSISGAHSKALLCIILDWYSKQLSGITDLIEVITVAPDQLAYEAIQIKVILSSPYIHYSPPISGTTTNNEKWKNEFTFVVLCPAQNENFDSVTINKKLTDAIRRILEAETHTHDIQKSTLSRALGWLEEQND